MSFRGGLNHLQVKRPLYIMTRSIVPVTVYQTWRQILDWSNLKAFAEDKIYVTEKLKFVLGRVEHNMGNGENAGY